MRAGTSTSSAGAHWTLPCLQRRIQLVFVLVPRAVPHRVCRGGGRCAALVWVDADAWKQARACAVCRLVVAAQLRGSSSRQQNSVAAEGTQKPNWARHKKQITAHQRQASRLGRMPRTPPHPAAAAPAAAAAARRCALLHPLPPCLLLPLLKPLLHQLLHLLLLLPCHLLLTPRCRMHRRRLLALPVPLPQTAAALRAPPAAAGSRAAEGRA